MNGQLDVAPADLGLAALFEFAADGGRVIAEEGQKRVAPDVLGLVVVAVAVDGNPVGGLAVFVLLVAVALVVLHVDHVVVGLREAAGDGFDHAEKAVEQRRAEIRVMDEIVRDAVDVGVDAKGVQQAEEIITHSGARGKRKYSAKEQPEVAKAATVGMASQRV